MATIMGDRIKQLRKQMHLTQDELADQLNERFGLSINKSMISKWENGKGDPYLSYAKYLAFHFGVNLDYLVGLTDQRSFVYYFDDWYENQEKERIRLERIERMTSIFERLNEKGQDKIYDYATDLLNSNMYSRKPERREAGDVYDFSDFETCMVAESRVDYCCDYKEAKEIAEKISAEKESESNIEDGGTTHDVLR